MIRGNTQEADVRWFEERFPNRRHGLHDKQELRTELTASGAAQKKLVVEAARRQRNVQATALDAAKAEAHQELQALRSKLAASDEAHQESKCSLVFNTAGCSRE